MSPRKRRSPVVMIVGALIALGLVGGFVAAIVWSQRLPEGPVEIVWDREACAHCHMHIGEPPFAAQLQLEDRKVLNFDDPGCLFSWLQANPGARVHAMYFHHLRENRWLAKAEVGFVEVSPTPMGFGLGAVERNTPGAISFEEAQARVARGVRGHEERK